MKLRVPRQLVNHLPMYATAALRCREVPEPRLQMRQCTCHLPCITCVWDTAASPSLLRSLLQHRWTPVWCSNTHHATWYTQYECPTNVCIDAGLFMLYSLTVSSQLLLKKRSRRCMFQLRQQHCMA